MTSQRLWYNALRWYVRFGLKFYYRKILIHGRENIPAGAVIFAANHQNAFMDALMIVCFNDHNTHFLTRADIFKKSFAKKVLQSLNMIPIYRIRDGIESLGENQKTFDQCTACFVAGDGVVIFPEGNHGSQRRVRPVSKGFTRIAFDAIQKYPELKILIVPVGLNYSDPKSFRSSVSVYFGEALVANDYPLAEPSSAHQLRLDVEAQLKTLTTHIADPDRHDEVISKLKESNEDFLNPSKTNESIKTILSGGSLMLLKSSTTGKWHQIGTGISTIINFIPLGIWKYVERKIKDPVFVGSTKFAVGIFLFPAYYLVVAIFLILTIGPMASLVWLMVAIPSMLSR